MGRNFGEPATINMFVDRCRHTDTFVLHDRQRRTTSRSLREHRRKKTDTVKGACTICSQTVFLTSSAGEIMNISLFPSLHPEIELSSDRSLWKRISPDRGPHPIRSRRKRSLWLYSPKNDRAKMPFWCSIFINYMRISAIDVMMRSLHRKTKSVPSCAAPEYFERSKRSKNQRNHIPSIISDTGTTKAAQNRWQLFNHHTAPFLAFYSCIPYLSFSSRSLPVEHNPSATQAGRHSRSGSCEETDRRVVFFSDHRVDLPVSNIQHHELASQGYNSHRRSVPATFSSATCREKYRANTQQQCIDRWRESVRENAAVGFVCRRHRKKWQSLFSKSFAPYQSWMKSCSRWIEDDDIRLGDVEFVYRCLCKLQIHPVECGIGDFIPFRVHLGVEDGRWNQLHTVNVP